jgi:hypothetical protein
MNKWFTVAVWFAMAGVSWAEPDAKKLQHDLDIEIMKRTSLQMKDLNTQIQVAAKPIMEEQSAANKRLCDTEKLKVEECDVNLDTGAVTKKAPPKADPPKPKN